MEDNKAKGISVRRRKKIIERIYYNNKMVEGSKNVANKLNAYFEDKVTNIVNNIEVSNENPMVHFKSKVKKPKSYLNVSTTTHNNVKNILSHMKSTNSACRDGISSRMLKKGKKALIPLLLNMIRCVILTKKYPKILKLSKIIPHYKNSLNYLYPKNMRPIHILSPLSKLIEKVMLQQMSQHLMKNNLVPQSMQGGFKYRSTTIAVMNIYQKLMLLK